MAATETKIRWVYAFGGGSADGDASMKDLLGGKGANLAEMCSIGLPVPPGFTVTTEACVHYYANGDQYPADLAAGRRWPRPGRDDHRQAVRRRGQPAAGVGPLRRPRLHAGHDGHGSQPRPE